MKIDQILTQIYTKNSIYDEIIDNILYPKLEQKGGLLSEIALAYLENASKIEDIYEKGYFKYYFINTVRNQVRSSSSSFHKNMRLQNDIEINDIPEINDISQDSTIEEKIKFEEDLKKVKKTKAKCGITWFESQMLKEYYDYNKTYRKIEEEYGLDHVLVFKTVKKAIKKIQNNL